MMSVQLDNQVEQHYETLPELLNDLSKMVQKNPEQLPSHPWNMHRNYCSWFATIDCSGDYHNLCFSSGGNRGIKPNDQISHTYEDLDSLYTELEYIREFLSTQEIGDFDLSYEIISNGGKPFLRVYLSGLPTPVNTEYTTPPTTSRWNGLIPGVDELRRALVMASVLPVVVIPTVFIIDKLRN